MAEIYRAKTFGAAGFEKEFAIKLILPSLVDDVEFVDMFINEAKIAVSLYHANIVQVFDLGELDEQYFIAMEYVHGQDLLDVLARCAELEIKIPLNLVLFITMEMLKGLDFAHRAKDPYGEDLNIVHRDVSPSNILMSYAGDVKVGDFGVAKAAIERNLTESGTLKGKVGYMSPEQVMGESIDNRSDVFSAGIVFFEALSMNRLFIGSSDLDVMLKVRDADIRESLKRAGPLPSDLIQIVQTGLARHREERYQTAGEFYQALVDFSFRHGIKVTGSDLSSFMRRLFAEEIEAEKQMRRSEPDGQAIQRHLAMVERQDEELTRRRERPASRPEAGEPKKKKKNKKYYEEGLALGETEAANDGEQRGRAGILVPARGAARKRATFEEEGPPEVERNYRYRDGAGLVFGPMGAKTLADLLRVRRPRREDRISIDGGPWLSIDEVDDSALTKGPKSAAARAPRQLISEQPLELSPPPQDGQGDTDVIRDIRQFVAEMAEESAASDDDDPPSISFDVPLSSLAGSSTEISPPSFAQGELGEEPSPVAGSAPTVSYLDELAAGTTFQDLREQYASYEGSLAKVSIARILARLFRTKETGRLFVQNGPTEKSIYFRDGEPIFIDSNKKEELLGHFLCSRRLISPAQLEEALNRLSEWGGRLGDALVAIRAVPAHAIFEHLSDQMREKLLEIFTWSGGYYGYYENQEPEVQGYALGLDAYQTIVEGTRERVDFERIKASYRSRLMMSIFVTAPPPFAIQRLGLRARELRVLNLLQSGESLRSLLERFSADQHEMVYRTIYLLHQVEILSFEVSERISLPEVPRG